MNNFDEQLRALIAETVRAELRRERTEQPDDYLSPAHAATTFDVKPATIRRWVKSGKLTRYGQGRVLRVSRAELERFMKQGAGANDDSPEAVAERRFG